MNNWIFTVTAHKNSDYSLTSQEVYDTRMTDEFWGLNVNTPNLKNLQQGDKVVFYLGRPNKAFAGTATLASPVFDVPDSQKEKYSHGISFYKPEVGVLIKDVHTWEEQKTVESLLDKLTFIKKSESWQSYFQGGVIRITNEDFQRIMDAVANTTPSRNWSESEVEETVVDYFDMLVSELKGEPYNKAEHRRALLLKLNSRAAGAVEFKHQNISAVLVSRALPYIDGYKPLGN